MPVSPYAVPLSASARPEITGGRRIGVLLSHGFTGSPHSLRPWAEHLAEQGYAVELPRLPGHGTSWQELNRTRWEDWCAELQRGFDRLLGSCDTVVVGGLSMGGGLALRLAADHPGDIAGVVVVNPAVATYRKDIYALPVLKHVVPAFPGIVNDIKKPGMDERGYPRSPLKAAASMFAGWQVLRADLGRVTAPLLILKSSTDHVVDELSLEIITSRVSSTDVTLRMLEDSFHVATLDHDAATILAESTGFVRRVAGLTAADASDVVG